MRPKTLAVLAVLVGALLALIYFAEDKVASTDERAAAAKRLVDAKPEELLALEFDWQGQRVRFEREPAAAQASGEPAPLSAGGPPAPGPWRIVAPIARPADDAAVGRLASTLTALEAIRDLDGAERRDVGLEPPRGSISWKSAKGEGRLEIGGAVPASSTVVVAAGGRRAPAVTSDGFLADLARPAGEWRSREVVGASRDRIQRIALTGTAGAPPVVLAASGETLQLESPAVDRVDRDLADRLFSDLAGLRMETFVDPPLSAEAERALASSAGRIELTLAGGAAPLVIEVGGETAAGKRLLRAGGQAFESASPLAATLSRPAAEWRSRNWTRFENWRIEKARVEEAAGSFELVRHEGEWLRDGQKIPFTAASDLLFALTSAKAESLVEGPLPTASPLPRLSFTLSDADGNEERLTLMPTEAGATSAAARTAGREVTLMLAQSTIDELTAKVAAVRAVAPEGAAPQAPGAATQPAPLPQP